MKINVLTEVSLEYYCTSRILSRCARWVNACPPLLKVIIAGSFSRRRRRQRLVKAVLYFSFKCRNSVNLFSTPISVQKFAQAKHAPTALNSETRQEKLAIAVRVLQKT